MTTEKIRLFLVDDHALFREGLIRLLEAEPDFTVAGRAGNIAEAVAAIPELKPDVVLLDVDLGGERGVELLQDPAIASQIPKILVVTAGASDREALMLVQAGVAGIMHKQKPPAELCQAIRQVARGEVYLEARYLRPLFQSVEGGESDRVTLTEREVKIMRLIFQGMANKEIGEKLSVAESTVKAALRVMFDKLGVRTRSQLVKVALEQYRDQL